MEQPRITEEDYFKPGHLACPGCGAALALKFTLKVLGEKTIMVIPASCASIIVGPYPLSAVKIPILHTAFATAGAAASGVRAALDLKGDTETTVVSWAGDGGTFDIGFQSLSGAVERNEDCIFVCYDNEAYMNTGVQRSSATPPAARTATTQAVGHAPGNVFGQGKNVPLIAMAHEIPYVATASVADVRDLERKVTKAMSLSGSRYIHILVPCPLGWGAAPQDTIRLARLATESGLFAVFEAEYGEVTGRRKIRRKVPVEEYLKPQKRFAHLFRPVLQTDVIAGLQAIADKNIRRFGLQSEGAGA